MKTNNGQSRWQAWGIGVLLAGLGLAAALPPPFARGGEASSKTAGDDVAATEARLLAEAADNIQQHRKADATLRVETADGSPARGVRVAVRQTGHEFLFGCIIFDLIWSPDPYRPEQFQERFRELFNFAVFPFYWARYEPRPGQTAEDRAVDVLRWCREQGIRTKGHPLVWTNRAGVPSWVRTLPPEEQEAQLLKRVRREVSRFAGKIDIWDVVNEPVNCRAWGHTGVADYIHEPIGRIADYVDKAFRAAHEANPQAHLILNEFHTIARPEVRQRFYELVQELQRRGTPLFGLGIQAHEPREHWYPPPEVWATFDRLGSLGYPLHITEFIPQSGGKPITGGWRTGRWTEATQAEFAEQFFRLSFGHPAVVSINWWGFSDRRIWLPGGGLVTEEYEPKPVYRRLRRLIREEWNTRADLTTDQDGIAAFRGFRGKYEITVQAPGQSPQTFQTSLCKDTDNHWILSLAR